MKIEPRDTVGVIGCGAMGAGIAQVAASAGHPVLMYDARPQAAEKAVQNIRAMYARLAEKGKLNAAAAQAAGERLRPVSGLTEMSGARLVIEAVVEDLAVKRALFAELEGIVVDETILATNTSSLSITALAAGMRHPGRVLGMHFFNPAPLMELVEIVAGVASDPVCLAAAHATAAAWGKAPVYAKSTPGFIVNRVARPYYGEALRLLGEQAGTPATIDALLREAGGFRMGPFELMDLIGLDVNFAVTKSVFDAYFGDRRYTPSLIQQEMVEAGYLGRKTGRGYYTYGEGTTPPTPETEPPTPTHTPALTTLQLLGDGPLTEALRARLAGHLSTAGATRLAITDGRTAARRASEDGIPNLVLADLALDYGQAKRIGIARAANCGDAAYRTAVAVLQAAGFAVSPLRDLPGLAVMRTVAMLVNEASDAVHTGVATAADVDLAMRKGVNYPKGPLAWGDAIGVERVEQALDGLRNHYGEDRYRVSPLLRQCRWHGRGLLEQPLL